MGKILQLKWYWQKLKCYIQIKSFFTFWGECQPTCKYQNKCNHIAWQVHLLLLAHGYKNGRNQNIEFKAGVTRYNFPDNLSYNVEKIYFRLQQTCYTLQSQDATCNSFRKSLQSLQEIKKALTIVASPKQCKTTCREGMLHVATYLQLVLQHRCDTSCKKSCIG